MSKDGNILEQLVKIRSTYELMGSKSKLVNKPTLIFEDVNYHNWMKIKRLVKNLNCGVLIQPEGNLDTINLVGHHKQYNISLKEAFRVCKKNNLPVGCSLVFMPKKLKWMNK